MKAIKLNEPHAAWVKKGIKKLLVSSKPIEEDTYVSVGLKAYGEIELSQHREISIREFQEMRDQHRISENERTEYTKNDVLWEKGPLHAYAINFKPFPEDIDYDLEKTDEEEKYGDPLFFDIKMDKNKRKPGASTIQIILEDIEGKSTYEIAKILIDAIEKYDAEIFSELLKELSPLDETIEKEELAESIRYVESPSSWNMVIGEKTIKFSKEKYPCVCAVQALGEQIINITVKDK